MANAFFHTSHALKQENTFWNKNALLLIAVLVTLWYIWMFLGSIALYKTSTSARLEAHFGRVSLDSPVSAQIFKTQLALGQEVSQGDVLIELDSQGLQLELAEIQARMNQINAQMPMLKESLEAEQVALHGAQSALNKMLKSTKVRQRVASDQVDYAKNIYKIIEKLHSDGYAAELEYFGAGNDITQAEAELQAQGLTISQVESEQIREQSSREAKISRLQQEYTQLEKQKLVVEASVKKLQYKIKQYQIKAPASGRITDVPDLRQGGMIVQGQRFATIITNNPLHIVAEFPIGDALGRIHKGQIANVRLHAFPWIQYGMLQASVREVDSESKTGTIRVELNIEQTPEPIVPQHGMTGEIEILVEQITPADLLLRIVGRYLTGESDI